MEDKKYTFDKLRMYFGEDYEVADGIVISQPSIGDILDYGEKEFYEMLNPFIINPTSLRVFLWSQNIDWTTISDYDLFYRLILQLKPTPEKTALLFGDLDFSKFNLYEREREKEVEDETEAESEDESKSDVVKDIVLLNSEQDVLIDEEIYSHMAWYLRTMFNIFPKVEKAKGRTTKEWMIEEDIQKSQNKTEFDSRLLPMVSFCVNHPGFKYKKNELKDLGIVEFNDSVQRLLVYEATSSLMKGMYSGFVDTSKIDKKEFDFMRDLN